MKLDSPGDVSAELRQLAGMLFPATAEEEWASHAVVIIESAARQIDALAAAESATKGLPPEDRA